MRGWRRGWCRRRGAGVPPAAELRGYLAGRLPGYMVPAVFSGVESLPLTVNGKVDRAALPAPGAARAGWRAGLWSRGRRTERVLAGIWCQVLGLGRVGAGDHFFELGAHSLLATRVVSRVRAALGVDVPVSAVFDEPTLGALAAAVDAAAAAAAAAGGAAGPPPVTPASRDGRLPLSFAQQRLWFLDRLGAGSAEYSVPVPMRLPGPVDVAALGAALGALTARHEVLRTRLVAGGDGVPFQVIDPPSAFPLIIADVSGAAGPGGPGRAAGVLVAADAGAPFDLAAGPLVRACLVRLGPGEHVLALCLHHVAADEWSGRILRRDLAALYRAFGRGEPDPLPPLPVQYADFALWQRAWLAGEVLEGQLGYWRRQLAGAPATELPADRPRPPVRPSAGRRGRVRGPRAGRGRAPGRGPRRGREPVHDRAGRGRGPAGPLRGRRRRGGRDPGREPEPGRDRGPDRVLRQHPGHPRGPVRRPHLRRAAGPGPRHRPGRLRPPGPPLRAARRRTRPPTRPLTQPPLPSDVHYHRGDDGMETELAVTEFLVGQARIKYDLSITMDESGGDLTGVVGYSTALFDAVTVERLVGHLTMLFGGVAADPGVRVRDLPMLAAGEREQLLRGWNDTAVPLPAVGGVHELIARRAAGSPDAVAVAAGDESLTYAGLMERAGRLAGILRRLARGRSRWSRCACPAGADMAVAVLAVWLAGAAYVPLDPEYPAGRLAFMLADSGAEVLVADRGAAEGLGDSLTAGLRTLWLDDPGTTARIAATPPVGPVRPRPGQLAYMIYTSGSTGRPKGVQVTHDSVVNLVTGLGPVLGAAPGSRVLQFASFSFDAAVLDVAAALAAGAVLVIAAAADRAEPPRLTALMRAAGIQAASVAPSLLAMLDPSELTAVTTMIVGSEPVSARIARCGGMDGGCPSVTGRPRPRLSAAPDWCGQAWPVRRRSAARWPTRGCMCLTVS